MHSQIEYFTNNTKFYSDSAQLIPKYVTLNARALAREIPIMFNKKGLKLSQTELHVLNKSNRTT